MSTEFDSNLLLDPSSEEPELEDGPFNWGEGFTPGVGYVFKDEDLRELFIQYMEGNIPMSDELARLEICKI